MQRTGSLLPGEEAQQGWGAESALRSPLPFTLLAPWEMALQDADAGEGPGAPMDAAGARVLSPAPSPSSADGAVSVGGNRLLQGKHFLR